VNAENRRRLKDLVTASTKLDDASRLAKEATVYIASSGLFPVEVREGVRNIAKDLDAYLQRITSAIEKL
jgi:hypothetical protein